MQYKVVDVFAERPLEGNPLTVFPNAAGLDDATMQAMARETNHSETTFVTGPADDTGAVPTRIFTPQTELPFAGHPTLGTAAVVGADALNLPVGRIPVRREGDLYWMTQNRAEWLGDQTIDVGVPHNDATIVSCGTPKLLIHVADSDAVRAASYAGAGYDGPWVSGAYVFTTNPDVPGIDVHARFFAPFVGVKEDPATGSAAGPVAAWMHRHGHLSAGDQAVIAQGIEMQRPSRLHVRLQDGQPHVGGKVQRVASGTFL